MDGHCEAVGRDPKAVTRTVNVGITKDDADLRQQFDKITDFVSPGVLMGEGQELVDRVGQYIEAGAEAVILVMRSPLDLEALDRFAETVIPAFTWHVAEAVGPVRCPFPQVRVHVSLSDPLRTFGA